MTFIQHWHQPDPVDHRPYWTVTPVSGPGYHSPEWTGEAPPSSVYRGWSRIRVSVWVSGEVVFLEAVDLASSVSPDSVARAVSWLVARHSDWLELRFHQLCVACAGE